MAIFSSIKEAIFGKAERPDPAVRSASAPAGQPEAGTVPTASDTADTGSFGSSTDGTGAPPSRSEDVAQVDVENSLDSMPGADRLNWRTSIVDLMKLIGVDSSLESRKLLARELGYTGELDGSAEMNVWLHKRTMQELARNGGKVPAEFLG